VGSPTHLVKEVHLPTGDLLLLPSSSAEATSYLVDLGADRHVVRVYVSAVEALCLKAGKYTPEVGEVLGRIAIILRLAYSPPAWRRPHGP